MIFIPGLWGRELKARPAPLACGQGPSDLASRQEEGVKLEEECTGDKGRILLAPVEMVGETLSSTGGAGRERDPLGGGRK